MISCKKCAAPLPEGARFCPACGKEQNPDKKHKKRGNGEGSVIKQPNGMYKAVVTLYYYEDGDGKLKRKTRSKHFKKRADAVAALPELKRNTGEKRKSDISFKALYDKWLPTHRAGRDTLNCYKAAFKHFRPVWPMPIYAIDVDDLQDCIDDCGHGKRTQQNMKTLVGLLYKFGIPRQHIPENLNLGPYLIVGGENAAHRPAFDAAMIDSIKKQIGATPGADLVYCMIYLGFRPSEFLALTQEDYDPQERCFTGGAKTEAGKGRSVTVSPKIQPYVDQYRRAASPAPFFPDPNGKPWARRDFTERIFYPVLEAAKIDNPIVEIAGGKKRHKFTPHSCRHTFATLLKEIHAPDKDKLELIGHTDEEMLRYYQTVSYADLRRITDAL